MSRAVENVITAVGRNLLATALGTDARVVFTRAELGTGVAADAAILENYTQLIAKFRDAVIARKITRSNGVMIVTVQYLNSNLEAATYVDEIGVFAKLVDAQGNDIANSECLFSYMTFGGTPDLILSEATATVQRVYDIPYVFNGSANITVMISQSGMITNDDVLSSEDEKEAGKLLRLNANGKFDVDITGDANTLDGHDADFFATADHDHDDATTAKHGYMSTTDKEWLDTLHDRVNQELNMTSSPTFASLTVNGVVRGARFE